MGTNPYDWPAEFRKIHQSGQNRYQAGERAPEKLFTKTELDFLASIGCTAQELFDFIDDLARHGEPEFEPVLLVQAVRREYLLVEQKGIPSKTQISMESLPAKTDEADGIA